MKFETLTYQASPAEMAGRGSGAEAARSTLSQGTVYPARVSAMAPINISMTFWLWMSGCVLHCLSALPKRKSSLGQHVVLWPSPAGHDAPVCALQLNRALARRLRRLSRLNRKGEDGFNLLSFQQNTDANDLSPAQYLEWIIRVYRYGRTWVYGLNATRRDLMRAAVTGLTLQGEGACLCKALPSSAPLSPD